MIRTGRTCTMCMYTYGDGGLKILSEERLYTEIKMIYN